MAKKIKIIFTIIVILYIIFWVPWLVVKAHTNKDIYYSVDKVPNASTAIVFGGLHHQGDDLTETNKERLLAAKELYDAGKIEKIVISNSLSASLTMKESLLSFGIPEDDITIDGEALATLDTCKNEITDRPKERTVVFVSHGYHLPRAIYQCNREGLSGIGFAPDELNLIEREKLPVQETLSIRLGRLHREAALTLASMLGLYEKMPLSEW